MDKPVGRLIAEAQPVREADLTYCADQELQALAMRILRDMEVEHEATRSKNARRICVGAGVMALLVGLAGPAAAHWLQRYPLVGDPAPHGEVEMNPSAAPAVLEALTQEYPLAPGYTTEPMIEQFMQKAARHRGTGARLHVLVWSRCTWQQTWLEARATRDTNTEAAAARMLVSVPHRGRRPVALHEVGAGHGDDARRLAEAVTNNPALIAQDVVANCNPVAVR